MRTILAAAMLAASTLVLPGCQTTETTTYIARDHVVDVSRRIADRYASTWNANDMAGFGALYAADARHVTLQGEFLRGRSAIVAAHRANRARYAESVRMVTRYEGARAVSRDAIVSVMVVEYVNDPARPGQVQSARLTTTLVPRGGDWVIAQAHASAVGQ